MLQGDKKSVLLSRPVQLYDLSRCSGKGPMARFLVCGTRDSSSFFNAFSMRGLNWCAWVVLRRRAG